MVKKEIRKFFNSVPMQENILAWLDEEKKKAFAFPWITVGLMIGISVMVIGFIMIKEDLADSE